MKSSQLWSSDDANLYSVGIFLDLVRSEGLRRWNMTLHEEYHYELFNRLPGYCGRDLHDTEDTDGFNPDVRMFANYAHSRPVGGETRGVDTIDTVYLCRTMSDNEFENQDGPDRRSETSGNDSPGLFQNPPMDMIQNIYRQSETDDDSDTDSTAELEYATWNDACVWEFRSASGNDSPGLIQNPPTDIIQNMLYCMDDDEYPEKLGNGGYVDGDIQYPRVCVRNNDNRLYPKLTGCCHTDDMDFLSPAGCYDCTCLMSLIWITTSLSS